MSKRTRFNHVSVKGDNVEIHAYGHVHYVPKNILDYRMSCSYHYHNPEVMLFHVIMNYPDGTVYYIKCVDQDEQEDIATELDALGIAGQTL
jgi:hypothetical protein